MAQMLLLFLACAERVPPPETPSGGDPGKAWSSLLQEAVSDGGVDYGLVREKREALDSYVAWISRHGPVEDNMRVRQEDEKIAFYINAYNAIVVHSVLDQMPLESVQSAGSSLVPVPGWSFFFEREYMVDGEWTNLFYLENQALVGTFQEPLVHAALNCASKGCPRLRYWRESDLKPRLRQGMKKLLNSSTGSRETGSGWAVSELFFWYERDFTDWSDAENLCQYLQDYGRGELGEWLAANSEDCPLERFEFDWSLNAVEEDGTE